MKVVILAGGFGSRISEESSVRPKPMVEIGSMPILWHIMKIYSSHGLNDFVICCGYKSHVIKDWFDRYRQRSSDVRHDFGKGTVEILKSNIEPWTVTLVETGADAMTGGRVKAVEKYLDNEPFCLTYGDGVGDIDISASIDFHKSHGKLVTMTAVRPEGRFGVFSISGDDNAVSGFTEKPEAESSWINGGFFVVEPGALDYIANESTSWESEPLQGLAADAQLVAHRHNGFWMPMDTLRDKNVLEEKWESGNAPWRCW